MSNFKPTHTGVMDVMQYGARPNLRQRVELRETARFYVDKNGVKYRKTNGCIPGNDWARSSLDVDTIEPVKEPPC